MKRWWHRWTKRAVERVEVDAEGVRRMSGADVIERVSWADLVRVSIMTTDEGPFCEDWYWLLFASDGTGCAIGQALACEVDLLTALQRLPRFNDAAVIQAAGSTTWCEFACWSGKPGEGRAAVEAVA